MSSGFGRMMAGDHGVAGLRGAVAGALSAGIAVAAHGWAISRVMPEDMYVPGSSAVTLVAAAAAVTGAAVSWWCRSWAGLVAVLCAGQVAAHLGLSMDSGHLAHAGVQLSPVMLGAHLLAVSVAAVVIVATGGAYRLVLDALARVVLRRRPAPIVPEDSRACTAHRERVVVRVLPARDARPRAPPVLCFL